MSESSESSSDGIPELEDTHIPEFSDQDWRQVRQKFLAVKSIKYEKSEL
jgi:hypothetical protein